MNPNRLPLWQRLSVPIAALVFSALLALVLSSCGFVNKFKSKERVKVDSVAVSKTERTAFSFQDSAVKREIIQVEEAVIEIEMESGDSADVIEDTLRIPVNGDDYFIPVKSKVKKVTVRNLRTTNEKDSAKLTKIDLSKSVKTDSVHKKAEAVIAVKAVKRCSFPYWWLIVIAGVIYLLYRRYHSFKLPL